jgi:hypothetical protein
MRAIVIIIGIIVLGQLAARAAESSKPPVVITAPARLEQRGDWTWLTISDAKNSYELPWALQPHVGSVALEPNRVYTFTIVEEPFHYRFPIPQVARVERDGKVIYDRETCEAHHVKMDRSLDSAIAALTAYPGAVVSPAKDSEWGRRAVVADPDGHRVELLQS